MDNILDTHIILQSISQMDCAFVDKIPNPAEQQKKDRFLDRVRSRISDILKNNNIKPQLFLVREYSDNMKSASIKNKLFMHSHVLIFIEKDKYTDDIIDKLSFIDNQYSNRVIKMRNYITRDKQTLSSIQSIESFIKYMIKDINKESTVFRDYQTINCPLREYISNQITLHINAL
jgi:hypothetical protein